MEVDDLCVAKLRNNWSCLNRWKYKIQNRRDGSHMHVCGVHYRKIMQQGHWRLVDVLPFIKGK